MKQFLLYISLFILFTSCKDKQQQQMKYDTSIVSTIVKEGLIGKVKTRTMTSCDDTLVKIIDSFDRDGFIVFRKSTGLMKEPHEDKWEMIKYEYLQEKHLGHNITYSIMDWEDSIRNTILSNNSFEQRSYLKKVKKLSSIKHQHLDSQRRYDCDTTFWYDEITNLITDTSYSNHYYNDSLHTIIDIYNTANRIKKRDTTFIKYHMSDTVGNPTKTIRYNSKSKEYRVSLDFCYTYTYYN